MSRTLALTFLLAVTSASRLRSSSSPPPLPPKTLQQAPFGKHRSGYDTSPYYEPERTNVFVEQDADGDGVPERMTMPDGTFTGADSDSDILGETSTSTSTSTSSEIAKHSDEFINAVGKDDHNVGGRTPRTTPTPPRSPPETAAPRVIEEPGQKSAEGGVLYAGSADTEDCNELIVDECDCACQRRRKELADAPRREEEELEHQVAMEDQVERDAADAAEKRKEGEAEMAQIRKEKEATEKLYLGLKKKNKELAKEEMSVKKKAAIAAVTIPGLPTDINHALKAVNALGMKPEHGERGTDAEESLAEGRSIYKARENQEKELKEAREGLMHPFDNPNGVYYGAPEEALPELSPAQEAVTHDLLAAMDNGELGAPDVAAMQADAAPALHPVSHGI